MDQTTRKSLPKRGQARRVNRKRLFLVLVAVMCLFVGLAYAFLGDGLFKNSSDVLANPTKGKINVLVLGVDEREDDVGRSDTCFVVTIDTVAKKVSMLSVPRDTRVKIKGHGWDKINHAFAFGGAKLSKESVENLLGIPIDYTVQVNFNGFVRMVDAIGGININVEKRMYYTDPYDDNGGLVIDLRPGMQKMDGKTAIQYVRYRDEEGDIGRVARQQKFIKAVLSKLTEPSIVTKLPDLVKEFAKAVKTDMPGAEMAKLIPIVSSCANTGLAAEMVPGTPAYIQDVSYWLPNIKELRTKVALIQGITIDDRYKQNMERVAREYEASIPHETKVVDMPAVINKNSDVVKPVDTNKNIENNTKTKTEIDTKSKTDTATKGQNNAVKVVPVPSNSTTVDSKNETTQKSTATQNNNSKQ